LSKKIEIDQTNYYKKYMEKYEKETCNILLFLQCLTNSIIDNDDLRTQAFLLQTVFMMLEQFQNTSNDKMLFALKTIYSALTQLNSFNA
jgi:hypothetical protein